MRHLRHLCDWPLLRLNCDWQRHPRSVGFSKGTCPGLVPILQLLHFFSEVHIVWRPITEWLLDWEEVIYSKCTRVQLSDTALAQHSHNCSAAVASVQTLEEDNKHTCTPRNSGSNFAKWCNICATCTNMQILFFPSIHVVTSRHIPVIETGSLHTHTLWCSLLQTVSLISTWQGKH